MSPSTDVRLVVCPDCAQAAAGITSEEAGRPIPEAPSNAAVICDEESERCCVTFSKSPCEGWCPPEHRWLAGERHLVVLVGGERS